MNFCRTSINEECNCSTSHQSNISSHREFKSKNALRFAIAAFKHVCSQTYMLWFVCTSHSRTSLNLHLKLSAQTNVQHNGWSDLISVSCAVFICVFDFLSRSHARKLIELMIQFCYKLNFSASVFLLLLLRIEGSGPSRSAAAHSMPLMRSTKKN